MGSREKGQTTTRQPLISSLVVRPSGSSRDGGTPSGGADDGSDYELGEVHRDPPPYCRSDRYSEDQGSGSPLRRRSADRRHSSDFEHSNGPPRNHGYGNGREFGRYQDYSPPYGRGTRGGRPIGRGPGGPRFGSGPFRSDGMHRNNPNVRPREGDWICPDPSCGNLNFARREFCNNCHRYRFAPVSSPKRGFPGLAPPCGLPRRFGGPPFDRSPGRNMNSYRSPPRGWARDGPRDFGGPPHPRHEGRYPGHHMHRDRIDYLEEDYRDRAKFDRPVPPDWGRRIRGRDNFLSDRKGYERHVRSPPPPPPPPPLPARPGGRWPLDVRERSRSPIRGGPPAREYGRDMYMDRGRDDCRGMGWEKVGDVY